MWNKIDSGISENPMTAKPRRKKGQLRIFKKRERGFTLLEVVITIGLLGIIAPALVLSLETGVKVLVMTDIRETARDLAEAQMENVQKQTYDNTHNPPIYATLIQVPDGFTVTLDSTRLGDNTTADTGIQHITVTIKRGTDNVVFTLSGQKVKW